MLVTSASRL